MVPVVLLAICVELVRLNPPSLPPALPWNQLADITVFSTLVYFGYRQRRNPAAHKRLMLIGTITLLDAAFGRWPVHFMHVFAHTSNISCYVLVLLIAGYDLWSQGRVHPATLSGGTLSIVSKYPVALFLYLHVPAHRLAFWMQSIGRHLY